jgi:hypothetical protein
VGFGGVLVGTLGVFVRGLMLTVLVELGCVAMRLGGVLVMLGCAGVGFVRHGDHLKGRRMFRAGGEATPARC